MPELTQGSDHGAIVTIGNTIDPGFVVVNLRHSQVALLIAQGEHPKLIADRLGHASPTVTMSIYAHLFPGLDAEAAERLERAGSEMKRTSDGLGTL
ncbi:MAG: hypothetical protein WBM90_01900 [Acidimicrobiia bacterium]